MCVSQHKSTFEAQAVSVGAHQSGRDRHQYEVLLDQPTVAA